MKKYYILCIAALFLVLSISCKGNALEKDMAGAETPDFKLQDLFYDTITLGSFTEKEQPVLLFFWTTWCPFCQKEIRVLKDSYGTLAKDGVEVLAIDVGETYNKVNALVQNYHLPFRVLLDKDSRTADAFWVRGVPTYVLINKTGDIVFHNNDFPSDYKDLLSK